MELGFLMAGLHLVPLEPFLRGRQGSWASSGLCRSVGDVIVGAGVGESKT